MVPPVIVAICYEEDLRIALMGGGTLLGCLEGVARARLTGGLFPDDFDVGVFRDRLIRRHQGRSVNLSGSDENPVEGVSME